MPRKKAGKSRNRSPAIPKTKEQELEEQRARENRILIEARSRRQELELERQYRETAWMRSGRFA